MNPKRSAKKATKARNRGTNLVIPERLKNAAREYAKDNGLRGISGLVTVLLKERFPNSDAEGTPANA